MSTFTSLPAELRSPLPASLRGVRRDQVRVLVIDRARRQVVHSRFDEIGAYLGAGDLLVVNTSRTLPAAVPATRADGSAVQVRPCVRRGAEWDALVVEPAPPHENVPLRSGELLRLGCCTAAVAEDRRSDIPLLWRLRFDAEPSLDLILENGEPIRYSYVPAPVPLEQYQPVYARQPGSAEAPSAGLPFSWDLLGSLRRAGVDRVELVLHTGLSSYQDDDFDLEHHLFEEWYEVPPETADAIGRAKRVVAVGTTVVRALETSGGQAASGWTSLQVGPMTPLRVVDALITGMHEPPASHFDILRALVDEELLGRAYEEAVARRYLWHEFGDATLVV